MPYRLVDVVAGPKTPRDRVALYDIHPDHPPSPGRPDGGEIFITANEPREPHRVAETPDVLQALRDGRLARWDDHAQTNPREARRGVRALQRRVEQLKQSEKDNPSLVLMPETASRNLAREEDDFDDEELAKMGETRGVDKWAIGTSATPGSPADAESGASRQGKEAPSEPIHASLPKVPSASKSEARAERGSSQHGSTSAGTGGEVPQQPLTPTTPETAGSRKTVGQLREQISAANFDELRQIETEEGSSGDPRSGVTEAIERRYRQLADEEKSSGT